MPNLKVPKLIYNIAIYSYMSISVLLATLNAHAPTPLTKDARLFSLFILRSKTVRAR
jgi:hypothetical protein